MKKSLFASLLLCAAAFAPVQAQAAGPTSSEIGRSQPAIQAGGFVVEFLICLKESHMAGASWNTATGTCMGVTARADTARRLPASSPTQGGEVRR